MNVLPVPTPPVKKKYSSLSNVSLFLIKTSFTIYCFSWFNCLRKPKYLSLVSKNGCFFSLNSDNVVACIFFLLFACLMSVMMSYFLVSFCFMICASSILRSIVGLLSLIVSLATRSMSPYLLCTIEINICSLLSIYIFH